MRQLFHKKTFWAIVFSLSVHLLAILFFILIQFQSEPAKDVEIFMQIPEAPAPLIRTPEEPLKPIVKNSLPRIDMPESEERAIEEEIVKIDSIKTDSVEKFDRTRFFVQSPQDMFRQPLKDMKSDSTDTIQITPFQPNANLFSDSLRFNTVPGQFSDRVQRDLYQKNMGHAPTVPLTQAMNEGAKYLSDLFNKNKKEKPVRLDFVPSTVELNILETIWEASGSTDTEIYAAIDTSTRITAVDLNHVLERLEEKGLVKRQLVSPQQLFTFPVGQVEMSAKNRRNRVYLYEAKINADEVLCYLQAVLYETEHAKNSANDSTRAKFIESLREKILRLVEAKG